HYLDMVGVTGSNPVPPTTRHRDARGRRRNERWPAETPAERATWTLPPPNVDTHPKLPHPAGALVALFCCPESPHAMIAITLPDGSRREFDQPVTVAEVAASIGPGLAKAALAGKVDGRLVDTSFRIERDAALEIVTDKHPDALEVVRHSTAHLLAQAVQRLHPGAQVTIGPVIDNGFYYDFAYERPFTPEDLPAIEEEMKRIAAEALPCRRIVKSRDEATRYFRDMGEEYKAQIIESIPADEELSLYSQGEFTDLCRGPHVPSTDKLRSFKLMKVAGAYWRGDHNNQMLSRIYGTAWLNDKDLKAYLRQIEEAEKRDHRRIAKQQDLFHLQEEAPGLVFWHPKGW